MLTKETIKEKIFCLRGKTIAIVYIYVNDNEAGMNHFFIWKSKILSKWMEAVEKIDCQLFLIDVRTFVDKAMNKTLPHIDYVLNMNSGTYDLSAMALVPSTCSILGIPCIPCTANTIIAGENKLLSNALAEYNDINGPKRLPFSNPNGIFRPKNLGNSMGVRRGPIESTDEGLYQEFINGYDVTIPMVYNPYVCRQDFLPALVYMPTNRDLTWYNGENVKKTRSGYSFGRIELCTELQNDILKFVNDIEVSSFCRIDARFKHSAIISDESAIKIEDPADFYFVEINVMPTIRPDNNFAYSFSLLDPTNTFTELVNSVKELFGECEVYMFLLICSMLAHT